MKLNSHSSIIIYECRTISLKCNFTEEIKIKSRDDSGLSERNQRLRTKRSEIKIKTETGT